MADGAANAGMIIVDVGTGQDQLLTVKTGNDDAFPVPDSLMSFITSLIYKMALN